MAEAVKKCPFCAEDILVAAKKCKHCNSMLEDSPVVIEKTGKKYKQQMLNGWVCAGIGLFLFIVGAGLHAPAVGGIGFLLIPVGVIWYFVARSKAWWHHG